MKHENQFESDIPPPDPDDPFPHTHPGTAEIQYQAHLQDAERRRQNRDLDAKIQRRDAATSGRGFEIQLIENFSARPAEKRWLVKNIVAKGETSAWIAPPGGMKSALLAELSICVARGTDWHGYKAKRRGNVLYFALERADLVRRRLKAHVERLGLAEDELLNIAVVPSLVDLMNPAIVQKVNETLDRAGFCFGGGAPDLVIFDTFAKAIAAGGGDEDKAKDQGRVFTHLAMIREEAMKYGGGGPHFAIVGHTGKDESRGARGSNAFRGDVDVEVAISGDSVKTATVVKANDMPEGPLFSFTSEVHEFGTDEDGDPITVNIVAEVEPGRSTPKGHEPRLSTNQRVMYRLLSEAGPEGLTVDAWNDLAREQGIATKQRHYEIRMALKDKRMVREYAGIWKVNNG
ncbi:AAA family ATPase [Bradyrhizobium sp. 139]|uniref:AAA family ATPase n=1 Tax=Bradyrhizobium sp. 139 TaxID=2782616 RepID=UPI001FF999D1|nr:AAA family ATPase [Bradyrhizobium sp. 139]MCK1742215.1 AAA family ATPase [Bradyrhizobium sp. 139]